MSAITVVGSEELIKAAAIPSKKTKEITWRGRPITIKEQISVQEYLGLIQHILRDCIRDENIAYEIVDFVTRVNIIGSYCFIDLPKDAQKLYDIVYGTDLYSEVTSHIKEWQLKNILNAVYAYTGIHGGEDDGRCRRPDENA